MLDSYREHDLTKITPKVKRNFKVRPLRLLEEKLLLRGELDGTNSELQKKAWGRNLSNILPKEYEFGFQDESNTITVIMGPTGDGKSTCCRTLVLFNVALIENSLNLLAHKYLSFSTSETFRIISKMNKGDILFQDENPILSGEGAKTIKDAVYNVQANVRANLNNFFFASPSEKGYKNVCHVLLETFGKNPKDWGGLNRVKVYSAKSELPLGYAIIPRLIDSDFEEAYNLRKKKHIKQIMGSGGRTSVIYDLDQLIKDAKILISKAFQLKENFPQIPLNKKCLQVTMAGVDIPGSTHYQGKVILMAELLLTKKPKFEDRLGDEKIHVEIDINKNVSLFENFIQSMHNFILDNMSQSSRSEHDIPLQCANIYRHWINQERPSTIVDLLDEKLPQITVERRLKRLNEFFSLDNGRITEQVGHFYEEVFCSFHSSVGRNVKQGSFEPGDFDAMVDGIVYSLKCYHNKKDQVIKIYYDDISKKEKLLAFTHPKFQLGISLLNPFWLTELNKVVDIRKFEQEKALVFRKPN
ncbi:MAG: hypothetical protein ACFFCI_02235 [Promethearchaeota archaeon]